MTDDLAVITATLLYKIGCLTVGSLFCLFGYRLFRLGIWGNAGDLDAKFKNTKFVLKSAAPGTFFAVLGGAIVMITVWQGLKFELHRSGLPTMSTATPPALPDAPGDSK